MKTKTIRKRENIQKIKFSRVESLFTKSFRLAKSNPSKTGLMILFDILFLISIFALNSLVKYFFPFLMGGIIAPTLATGILFITFSLIYYLIALFAYSFFKYSVLDSIKSLFTNTESSFKRLGQFYALNIVIAGIFFALSLIAGFFLTSIKPEFQIYVFFIIASPFWVLYNKYSIFSLHSIIFYVILNLCHTSFYQGASIKESLKNGFKTTFTKIRIYRETILVIIILALFLWLLLYGIGYVIQFAGAKNYALYLKLYSYFSQASSIAFLLVFYVAILVNRISFYNILRSKE